MIDLLEFAEEVNEHTNWNVTAKALSKEEMEVTYHISIVPDYYVKRIFSAKFLSSSRIAPANIIYKWLEEEFAKWHEEHEIPVGGR